MSSIDNQMMLETLQAPELIKNQLKNNLTIISKLAKVIKQHQVTTAVTIARGSSDHAANFAKYIIETQLGIITASSAPSVHTLYDSKINMKNMLVIGISQSGKSPDICEVMQHAKNQGAITVAIVNKPNSPLAQAADWVIPLHAGEEIAVAATKSFMCSITAILQLAAIYNQDTNLIKALDALPDQLNTTLQCNWSQATTALLKAKNMFVVARGISYPIAQECALKFKETSCIQAEPFSSAEVLHGPFALMQPGFPVLQFIQDDITQDSNIELAQKMTALGVHTILALPENIKHKVIDSDFAKIILPLPNSLHPLTDPVMIIQAFYKMANHLAVARGFNPDKPDNLNKVTETK